MRQQVQRGRAAALITWQWGGSDGDRAPRFRDDSEVFFFFFFLQTSGEEIRETPQCTLAPHEPTARLATCHWPDQMPLARPNPPLPPPPPGALKANDTD